MAAIDDLKTEWLEKIATISDSLQKADATFELDSLIAAKTKVATLEASLIDSYSITGRTVTKRSIDIAQAAIQRSETKLVNLTYGSFDLVDMGHVDGNQ